MFAEALDEHSYARETRVGGRSANEFTDHAVSLGDAFALENGGVLERAELRFRSFGSPVKPITIVAGGISATRKVADASDGPGWWPQIVRPDGVVDTQGTRVVGFDFLPGPEDAGKTITPRDQARALALALDAIGIADIDAFVGASYGGVIGLAFAAEFPQRLRKLAVVSAADRPDPMATALRGIQRRIIKFASECGRPQDGVALARELAMTTYRSEEEFRARFGSTPSGPNAGDPYDVCEYLSARGKDYARKVPAARYLTLSDSMDRADIDVSRIAARALLIAVENDRLVPPAAIRVTAEKIGARDSFFAFESRYGHDAFLCDAGALARPLGEFLKGTRI